MMDQDEATRRARAAFLDDRHERGCAETTFMVLKEAFGLDDPDDTAAAMALNGGVGYSGGTCGAVTGAAMAAGLLSGARIDEHRRAKRVAGVLTARLVEAFEAEHGSTSCRVLIGRDIRTREQHDAFIASGVWRETCMRQIESTIRSMLPLADAATWDRTVREIEAADRQEQRWNG